MLASLSFYGCEKEAVETTNPKVPNVARSSEDTDEILRNNVDRLREYQRIIALSTLDLSINNSFKEVVHALTDSAYNGSDSSDYYASFKSINRRYALAGHDMFDEMKTSLLAHGGSANDASTLEDIYLGIDIDGILLETGLRLSYKDGMYQTNSIHTVTAKQFQNFGSVPVWLNTETGFTETTRSANEINSYPAWTINFLPIDTNYDGTFLTSIPADGDDRGGCRKSRVKECNIFGEYRRCRCSTSMTDDFYNAY